MLALSVTLGADGVGGASVVFVGVAFTVSANVTFACRSAMWECRNPCAGEVGRLSEKSHKHL